MQSLVVADLGRTFGMQAGSIFSPFPEYKVVAPESYSDFVSISDKVDLVLFGGGGDIHPSLYKSNNVATHAGTLQSSRDVNELASFRVCIAKKIPVLGICRGAQLACAVAGGYLVQHLDNHAGSSHDIVDVRDDTIYRMSSAHHQMMFPHKVKHILIAKTPKPLSKQYKIDALGIGEPISIKEEPEIIYFPEIKALGVQGHPEFMGSAHPTTAYVRKLVHEYLVK